MAAFCSTIRQGIPDALISTTFSNTVWTHFGESPREGSSSIRSLGWIIKALAERARNVFWLNPEPKSYWDTGDSIISEYSQYCDGIFEVRNLRQLESFADNLA